MPVSDLQARLDVFSQRICLPVVLLLNFSLFQYLFTVYFARFREPRVIGLLIIAAIGFISIGCFTDPDPHFVLNANSISEVCTVMTFLMQITILGRDVLRRIRIRTLRWSVWAAEFFLILGVLLIIASVVDLALPAKEFAAFEDINFAVQNGALLFTFMFRWYFVRVSNGARSFSKNQKMELLAYFFFVTHEYPFVVVEQTTGITMEYIQAVYMRLLMALCLGLTLRNKIVRSQNKSVESERRHPGVPRSARMPLTDVSHGNATVVPSPPPTNNTGPTPAAIRMAEPPAPAVSPVSEPRTMTRRPKPATAAAAKRASTHYREEIGDDEDE